MQTKADLRFSVLSAGEIEAALDDLAQLRIAVFAAWPYLYDGDRDYEARYVKRFASSSGAMIVAARTTDGRMVGAATAAPLVDHAHEFAAPFARAGLDPSDYFYLAESVLLPEFRGSGAGRVFFDMREAGGRAQGFKRAVFACVVRPVEHPMRPETYVPLSDWWQRLGYAPLDGVFAEFSWRDQGDEGETVKRLQVWEREI